MGIAGALVALLAASLALTVLPALLSVLGPRVNALAPRWLARAADRDARPAESGFWYRLSRLVMRRPAPIAITSATVLIVLGIPFFTQVKFISVDARVLPSSGSARQVNDILDRDFPPNRTSPLDLVVGAPPADPGDQALEARLSRPAGRIRRRAGPTGRTGRTSLIAVAPARAPLTDATKQLVHDVRALHVPYYLGVAGETAAYVDLEHSLAVHLPAVLAVVVATTLIILFLMTGSVILPIKAVVMNALGLSAMFGILVLIFQDGNLEGLLSYRSLGALDATQPILLFAVGFGLATDYGVFLLSRIKEARDAGASDAESVATGLERTGRVVTAAALLFAVALGAFSTSEIVFVKELGLGAVLAVLIDASIIRALLVPSLMQLLGPLNWWAPRPLRRLHDRIGLGKAPRRRCRRPVAANASAADAAAASLARMPAPQSNGRLRAVVFDLGGVLLDWDPRYLYRKLFDDEVAMERFLSEVCTMEWHHAHDLGVPAERSCRPWWRPIQITPSSSGPGRGAARRCSPARSMGASRSSGRFATPAFPVYALTNMERETYPVRREKLRVPALVRRHRRVRLRGRGEARPAGSSTLLLERFDLAPESTVMIDDSPANVEAARRAGMHAIEFESPARLRRWLTDAGLVDPPDPQS